MPFSATWMQLEIIILSEVSQKEKDKYHVISLIFDTNEPICEKETESGFFHVQHREQTGGYKGEGVGGEMEWEVGVSRCKLLQIEWINNKVLL